jgi:hypothetical protein
MLDFAPIDEYFISSRTLFQVKCTLLPASTFFAHCCELLPWAVGLLTQAGWRFSQYLFVTTFFELVHLCFLSFFLCCYSWLRWGTRSSVQHLFLFSCIKYFIFAMIQPICARTPFFVFCFLFARWISSSTIALHLDFISQSCLVTQVLYTIYFIHISFARTLYVPFFAWRGAHLKAHFSISNTVSVSLQYSFSDLGIQFQYCAHFVNLQIVFRTPCVCVCVFFILDLASGLFDWPATSDLISSIVKTP